MPLTDPKQIEDQALVLDGFRRSELDKLDKVRRYWKGKQDLPQVVPTGAPNEVKVMAKMARVNVCDLIVESLTQSLFVEGLRVGRADENLEPWGVWQRNRFDRRQTGVHRAALAYGTSYAVVTPGDSAPVIRGASPRGLTTLYGEDPDWPMWALEKWGSVKGPSGDTTSTWRMYDDEVVYFLQGSHGSFKYTGTSEPHRFGVCPVVRFVDADDLDATDDIDDAKNEILLGQVAPMMNLQDQIDLTSFNLLTAQHYGAFRQRYIIGWTSEDEDKRVKMGAARLMTFDDIPENVKVGEFGQTDLKGYIDSREAALKYAATISQTPVHELIGELVNLSAEALRAAEAGKDRKVAERKTSFGESWEQVFQLVGDVPDDAEVRWRDTSAQAFGATVDALGKLAALLGIPPRGLWERVPGVTDGDIKSWGSLAKEGDAFARLEQALQRQSQGEAEPA